MSLAPQRYPLDAQSWTRAHCLSSRVVAVTTTTYTLSTMYARLNVG